MPLTRFAAALLAVALTTMPAHAQVDISTGTGNGWQVACSPIGGAVATPLCDGSFFNAVQVTPGAGDWPAGPWIGAVSSGSLGQTSGETPRWQMTFRKYVTFTGVLPTDVAVINVSRLLLDNYFVSASLNSTSFTPAWSGPAGAPLPATGSNWQKEFAFSSNVAGALVEGSNYLDIVITGNGATDMLALTGTIGIAERAEVPEPASAALLLLGLGGVGLTAVRRRTTN